MTPDGTREPMKRFIHLCLCSAMSLSLTACFDSSEVKLVKGGVLQFCPNHTVDQMVKSFMGSPSWESGKSSEGVAFVNVAGDITFHDKPVRAKMQFLVAGDNFSFNAFEMNGVPSADIIAYGLLNKMCLSAEGSVEGKSVEKTPNVPAPPPITPASTESSISGIWKGSLEGDGQMEVTPVTSGFDVAITVSSPSGCFGAVKGTGQLSDNILTLTKNEDDQLCKINIKFAGDTASIDENNCSYYHGAACSFYGTLKKVR